MGHPGFNRQWARAADGACGHHPGGRGPWGWEFGPGARRQGPPPWVAGLFGLAQANSGRGPRVRRGDVRAAIVDVLRGEPMNGYQIISQIGERTGGAWRPSPGSVYPTVQQLEDEGLVEYDEAAGRRSLRLTAEGEAYAAEHEDELAGVWAPFAESGREDDEGDYANLKPEIAALMNAVWQIVTTGTEQQRRDAVELLVETRRKLYGLLADGDAE